MNKIDYNLINEAEKYYKQFGYTQIELPWYVTKEIAQITRPENHSPDNDYYLSINNKVLVASGEQSFLYLATKGQLPEGFYIGTTPCFRFEPIDLIHRKTFIKSELIYMDYNNNNLTHQLDTMVELAQDFFQSLFDEEITVKKVKAHKSKINYDLMVNNYELGSYGIRQDGIMKWVYGTGIAEPRTSYLIKLFKNENNR